MINDYLKNTHSVLVKLYLSISISRYFHHKKYFFVTFHVKKKVIFFKKTDFSRIHDTIKPIIKAAVTDMICFARIQLFGSLVQKKIFNLIRQVVFKLEYLFCQGW